MRSIEEEAIEYSIGSHIRIETAELAMSIGIMCNREIACVHYRREDGFEKKECGFAFAFAPYKTQRFFKTEKELYAYLLGLLDDRPISLYSYSDN
jgi:hypothetical protein